MNSKPIQVLLVEDDPDDVLLIEDMLDEAGGGLFSLVCAGRLSAALERIGEGRPDVILLDLSLPDSRGFETFVQMYAQAPGVPVVVLTGLSDEELAVRAVQEGAQDYLVKGQVNDDLLVRAIRYAIERHQLLREKMERVEQELRLAAEIQKAFLPDVPPRVPGFELGGHSHPCGQIGGDFYDFLVLPDGRVGVAVGDAAGKGVPGALVIAKAQGVLRAQAENIDQIDEVIATLNRLLCQGNEMTRFVTLFYAVLDARQQQVTYVNAGHPPAFLFREDRVLDLVSTGPPLGMFAEAAYHQQQVRFAEGDLLVTYSDGVPEAQDRQGRFFEACGIRDVVQKDRLLPVVELADAICEAAERFELGAQDTPDDKTVVVVRSV